MNYMGIDHHRQCSHITLLDEKGEVVKSGRVANLRRELEDFLFGVKGVKAVIEAGRSSYTMVDVLDDMGIEDIKRFDDVRKFHAYAGLIPSSGMIKNDVWACQMGIKQ
jgi:hypothetical protein